MPPAVHRQRSWLMLSPPGGAAAPSTEASVEYAAGCILLASVRVRPCRGPGLSVQTLFTSQAHNRPHSNTASPHSDAQWPTEPVRQKGRSANLDIQFLTRRQPLPEAGQTGKLTQGKETSFNHLEGPVCRSIACRCCCQVCLTFKPICQAFCLQVGEVALAQLWQPHRSINQVWLPFEQAFAPAGCRGGAPEALAALSQHQRPARGLRPPPAPCARRAAGRSRKHSGFLRAAAPQPARRPAACLWHLAAGPPGPAA